MDKTVYYLNSYDITDPETYSQYGPAVYPILAKYGAEVLASDTEAIAVEGEKRTMHAIVKFPSEEAALQCYDDPEYQAVKAIRHKSTAATSMILVKALGS